MLSPFNAKLKRVRNLKIIFEFIVNDPWHGYKSKTNNTKK